jgi:hypothetical protein
MWALPELIEAASRTGQTGLAAGALGRLTEATSIGQTGWAPGIYARCQALLSDGQDAEGWYRQAIDRLSRTRLRTELARAHLLYGEWLRRERRRAEARAQLRTAHDMFDAIGMQAFAERARREPRRADGMTGTGCRGAHPAGSCPVARSRDSGHSNGSGTPARCRVQRYPVASATAAAMDRASGLTAVPATRTVGVASTLSAAARAVTYGAQSR